MIEEIDTNSNFDSKGIPDGKHTFRILEIRKNSGMYIFNLSYEGNEGEQVFFPNSMGPLLKVLECKESEKGKYMIDTDQLIGKSFSATVFREPSKKDKTKIYQNMKEFDEVPF